MFHDNFRLIYEEFDTERISPAEADRLLESGWRHFGTHFFRYNVGFLGNDIRMVIPLRIRLSEFAMSKGQRRVMKANRDMQIAIGPIEITRESENLFHDHKLRFRHNIPVSIYDFLSHDPANTPSDGMQISVRDRGRLVAISYFDTAERSTSGIYAAFDPRMSAHRLGIFTMLLEIEYSISAGREFYYQGYCYRGESFYDYKKRFRGTEAFDWNGNWLPLTDQA